MNLEIFAICKSGGVQDGRMFISDIFDTISFDRFPVTGEFPVAVRIRFFSKDNGLHDLKLATIDADGEVVMSLSKQFTVTVPHKSDSLAIQQVFATKTEFENPGRYTMSLYVDDNNIISMPLYVGR